MHHVNDSDSGSYQVRFSSPGPYFPQGIQSRPKSLRLLLQPPRRPLIPLEVPRRLLPNLLMILINPLLLVFRKQFHVNKLLTQRGHGDMLEAEPGLVAELVGRGYFTGHDDIFDADAEVVVFIVAGF
jgi:hypothetical protein